MASTSLELKESKIVSTLLNADLFTSTEETLGQYAVKNTSVILFLRIVGLIWSSEGVLLTVCQYAWNIFIRDSLLVFIYWGVYVPILFLSSSSYDVKTRVMFVLLGVTMVLQATALLFAIRDMYQRLNKKVTMLYVLNLTKGLDSAYFVLVVSLAISLVPLSVGVSLYGQPTLLYVCYIVTEIPISLLLTAATYFISTDCVVAISLLDQLIEQQKLQSLTFEEYSLARNEVSERQKASSWINNSVVLVALLEVCTILLFIFISLFQNHNDFLMVAILLKELPYLVVVYWQVAQVNEKSYSLLKKLSSNRWNAESNTDHERMAIYITAQGNPIVMSLAGMKLKRRDLAWQFALWCFAFLISILKAAVASEA